MTSSTTAVTTHTSTRTTAVQAGALAALGSVVLVELVALVGKGLGAPEVQALTAIPLASLTVVGVAVATAAWVVLGQRAGGTRLLDRLIPTVLVVSFVPDVLLGFLGTPWASVATLMVAHLAVFLVTIPVLRRMLPLPRA